MQQVDELVSKGMIRNSSSSFFSPALLVHKKDGTYRVCVDYRALNKITIKNRFPMPKVKDLFDKLQGVIYFNRVVIIKQRYLHKIFIRRPFAPRLACLNI